MTIDRDFLSQVVIVLAVCAGAWMMLVQPKAAEVARLHSQLAESSSGSDLSSPEGIEAMAGTFATYKQRLQVIRQRNAQAEDTSSLYAAIMRLAMDTSVRVQALQPMPARDSTGKPQPFRQARLEMTVSGEYLNLAKFMDRVSEIDAFIRPASLQMTPIDNYDGEFVSARFTCDVLSFSIEDVLAGLGGTADAQP